MFSHLSQLLQKFRLSDSPSFDQKCAAEEFNDTKEDNSLLSDISTRSHCSLLTQSTDLSGYSLEGSSSCKHRQRKRRAKGFNVYVEGTTTEHCSDEEQSAPPSKSSRVRGSKSLIDNFALVKCLDFVDSAEGCPYEVVLESTAAAVIDIHAHLCKTEVIGLLGGHYDSESRCLKVHRAEPCSSQSTSIHCDMDPVSQTRAGQLIQDAGLNVVGWYHSHPTFIPDPSKQDVESQETFQMWFSRGGDHFLGLIISPYNINNQSTSSEIRCFSIVNKEDSTASVPYKFDYRIVTSPNSRELPDLVRRVAQLLDMYKNYEHCVDLLDTYRSSSELSSLDKMMLSVRGHLLTADPKEVDVNLIMEDLRFVITSFCERIE